MKMNDLASTLEFKFKTLVVFLLSLTSLLASTPLWAQSGAAPSNTYQPLIAPAPFSSLTVTSSQAVGDEFANKNFLIDADLNNGATWNYLIAGSAWIEVRDNGATGANVYPTGSYAGFVIGTSALLDLAGSISVETYLGGALQETYNASNGALSVSLLGNDRGKIGLVTTMPFDAIRINFSAVGAGSRTVYYAEVLVPTAGPVPDCNTLTPLVQTAYPAIVNSGTTGVAEVNVGLLSDIFADLDNIVDANTSNAGTITLPALNVLTTAYVSVTSAGVTSYPAGYFAGFDISNSTLAGLGLASNVSIVTYLDGTQQESATGDNLLLSAPLLSGSSRSTIGFVTTLPFDEIRYVVAQPANVSLGTTSIYAAVIKQFCAGTLVCNTPTPMNAASQPVYIDIENTGVEGAACVSCAINNVNNIIDGNTTTAATLNFAVGALSTQSLAVRDAVTDYPAGTYAGYDIEMPTLLSLSVPNAVVITLMNDGAVVQTTTGPALLAGVSTGLLTSSSRQHVGVIATVPFDEVKITFNSAVGANLGTVMVYDVIWQQNCTSPLVCNTINQLVTPNFGVVIDGARTGFNGLVTAASTVRDASNVINSNLTDFATIEVAVGALADGSIAVVDGANTFPAGTFAGFLIRDQSPPLLLADLLKGITITTYNNGVPQESRTTTQLLGLTVVVPILGNYGLKNVGFTTTLPYDEIQITVADLVNAALPRKIDVFGAVVDTRFVTPGTPGLSCPFVQTNPDINYGTINTEITGSVATNDKQPANASYSGATPAIRADGASNPSGATITLNNDGSYSFQATQIGVYQYQTTMTDPATGILYPEMLTIIVTDPTNTTSNPPVVNTDIATVPANTGTPTSVIIPVLINDAPSNENKTLGTPTIPTAGQPKHGTAVVNPDGTVTYSPEEGFVGRDTIVYNVCEQPEGTNCGSAFIIVNVTPSNINTTQTADDFAKTTINQAVSGNVKTNDTDAEGNQQTITVQNITDSRGTFTLAADGSFTFTPANGYSGVAQFTYTTTDNGNPQASANGTLYVYTLADGGIDLQVTISVLPAQVTGAQSLSGLVSVSNPTTTATDGTDVTISIPKSPNYTISFDPALTSAQGLPVGNADWTLDNTNNSYYLFKLGGTNNTQAIAANATSRFGITITFAAGTLSGTDNMTATVVDGSGGEADPTNNNDSDKVVYNPEEQ
ncbi:hypothetical protein GCM10027051_34310 [Niabella terrae]